MIIEPTTAKVSPRKLGSVDDLLVARLLLKFDIIFASMSTSCTNRWQLVLLSVSYFGARVSYLSNSCRCFVLLISSLMKLCL